MTNIPTPERLGPHAEFIEQKLPTWIKHSHPKDLKRLRSGAALGHKPDTAIHLHNVPQWLRQGLLDSLARSRRATVRLAKTLKGLQGITEFAEPKLQEALHSHHTSGRAMDVNKDCLFYLQRDQPVQTQTLLQAALHNFEGNESFTQLVHGQWSALAPVGALIGTAPKKDSGVPFAKLPEILIHGTGYWAQKIEDEINNFEPVEGFHYRETLPMTPDTFSTICRTLDLGQQYQDHLADIFDAPQKAALIRQQMVEAQKELMSVHLHTALIKKDISQEAHQLLSAVLNGQANPTFMGKPVVFGQLRLYDFTLANTLIIGPYRSSLPTTEWVESPVGIKLPVIKTPEVQPLLAYIPGASDSPLKEYASLEAFEHDLAIKQRTQEYQQLLSSLVPQGKAQDFLKRLYGHLYAKAPDPKGIEPPAYNDDVDLKIGQQYIEVPSAHLFFELTRLHLERIKADARVLAVPTADADSKLLMERLEYLAGLGIDALNVAAFFIPGAGEVMMAVMALQIGMEIYEGLESFNVGDMDGAWSHLESVAINVGIGAVIAGAGFGISKIPAGTFGRWAENVKAIALPGGKNRLWKPDLATYQADLTLDLPVEPDALGQYTLDGKTWVKVDGQTYEQTFDEDLKAWRVKHPTDSDAYQPVLKHNNDGAWHFDHERPLSWERPALLRRLGHKTRMFDDATLAVIGEVSGVSDRALRKVFIEGLPIPAPLADTLDQFAAIGKLKPVTPSIISSTPEVALLRRRFKGLSESAAQEIISQSGARDMARLRAGRVSGRVDDLCRRYSQVARLNRALAGFFEEELASSDSRRLVKYITANRPEMEGLYGLDLTRAVGRYATSHRVEMEGVLKIVAPRSWPSIRLDGGGLGYALSGRGEGMGIDASLVSRFRDVYPEMDDEMALEYVLGRLKKGHTERQIYNFIATQQRESEALRSTLEHWVNEVAELGQEHARRAAVEKVMKCWRQGVFRNTEPHAYLDLGDVHGLPPLEADFSHVRALRGPGSLLLGASGVKLTITFPNLQSLEVEIGKGEMMPVIEKIATLPDLKELTLSAWGHAFTPAFLQQLASLSTLQRLTLIGSLDALDVSRMVELRALNVSSKRLNDWPKGILELKHLDTLDLQGCSIQKVPGELFSGHEQIWRGLRLNWSLIDQETLLNAYDYLYENPAHLADMEQWVRAYCKECLTALKPGNPEFSEAVLSQLSIKGLGLREQLFHVASIHEEHQVLIEGINAWLADAPLTGTGDVHSTIANVLKRTWQDGLPNRLGLDEIVEPIGQRLVISARGIDSLPKIPRSGFNHVKHLALSGLDASIESLDNFLGAFTHVRRLNLSRNRLFQLPSALSDFTQLGLLDLSYNELSITRSAQERLNRLSQLQVLNLRCNRVGALSVKTMTHLQELDLSLTAISEWPEGVLDLPEMRRLDLSRSAITKVPNNAFQGHDTLMAHTRLNGCKLTHTSCTNLLDYADRTGSQTSGGITKNLLAEGKTGGEPEFFPVEVSENPDMLLPTPLDPALGDELLTPAARLQRIDPELSVREAVDHIEQWITQGEGALEIDARLEELHRQKSAITQQLNQWIDRPSYKVQNRWVSAQDRRRAADRLVQAWRQTLISDITSINEDLSTLDFSDLSLGDLPVLPVILEHVAQLDVSGVALTEQSANDFLRSFPRLRTLRINNNALIVLPESLGSLEGLTRLEATDNALVGGVNLQSQLNSLENLDYLDLSRNKIERLDVTNLSHLKTLKLSHNELDQWPTGLNSLSELAELVLNNNQIENIPNYFNEDISLSVMAVTDLTDNPLSREGLELLEAYNALTGNRLGFSESELEELSQDLHDSDLSFDDSDPEDEDLSQINGESLAKQKARWFEDVPADSPKHPIWSELLSREGHESLFYLLTELEKTQDFLNHRVLLTSRVWEVLEAAYRYPVLCNELFIQARAPIACGDGRILLFSDLEISVHEFNVLRDLAPEGDRGKALLGLYKGLFRLGEVEKIARQFLVDHPEIKDVAEVRLAYRIKLSGALELPKQPLEMKFTRYVKLTQMQLDSAYNKVLAAEASPEFVDYLLERNAWVDHLKAQFPNELSALEVQQKAEKEALEDSYPVMDETYNEAAEALGIKLKAEKHEIHERFTIIERSRAQDN
ncbi:DUF6543 domain-containing protein [Pseudomonas sp. SIMBA_077]